VGDGRARRLGSHSKNPPLAIALSILTKPWPSLDAYQFFSLARQASSG
jgi:hypothetical protein